MPRISAPIRFMICVSSLRRCRSLADGLMALDPDPEWKAMKKAGKGLFQRLGDLRDIHVMEEWVENWIRREGLGKKQQALLHRTLYLNGDLSWKGHAEGSDLPLQIWRAPENPEGPRTGTKARSASCARGIRSQTVEAVEQVATCTRGAISPGQRNVQTSRSGALDRRRESCTTARCAIAPKRHSTHCESELNAFATSSRIFFRRNIKPGATI